MEIRRLAPSLLLAACAATLASNASAQESSGSGAPFGARAQNVLVVDELVGIYRETIAFPDEPKGDETGWLRVGTHDGAFALNESTRFGYHRFVTPEISVGTGLHYSSRDETAGYVLATDGLVQKVTTFGISPRVGFVFAGTEAGAFWLRFGFQYYHYDLGSAFGSDVSAWDFGPGVELFYVITPFEHFGITIGPTLEVGLAGKLTVTNTCTGGGGTGCGSSDTNVRRRTFGLALGFLFDL